MTEQTKEILEFLLLEKDEIVSDIGSNVKSFLAHEEFFNEDYKRIFTSATNKYILKQIRLLIQERFNLNFEEAQLVIDELQNNSSLTYFLQKRLYK